MQFENYNSDNNHTVIYPMECLNFMRSGTKCRLVSVLPRQIDSYGIFLHNNKVQKRR